MSDTHECFSDALLCADQEKHSEENSKNLNNQKLENKKDVSTNTKLNFVICIGSTLLIQNINRSCLLVYCGSDWKKFQKKNRSYN